METYIYTEAELAEILEGYGFLKINLSTLILYKKDNIEILFFDLLIDIRAMIEGIVSCTCLKPMTGAGVVAAIEALGVVKITE